MVTEEGAAPKGDPNLDFAPAEVKLEHCPDGGMILRSPQPLLNYERQIGNVVRKADAEVPQQVFLAERKATGEGRQVTFAEARKMID